MQLLLTFLKFANMNNLELLNAEIASSSGRKHRYLIRQKKRIIKNMEKNGVPVHDSYQAVQCEVHRAVSHAIAQVHRDLQVQAHPNAGLSRARPRRGSYLGQWRGQSSRGRVQPSQTPLETFVTSNDFEPSELLQNNDIPYNIDESISIDLLLPIEPIVIDPTIDFQPNISIEPTVSNFEPENVNLCEIFDPFFIPNVEPENPMDLDQNKTNYQ